MKLSIITINRNNASGIDKTLSSVDTQDCKDFEHIIIDGASSDESVDVIRRHEPAKVNRKWISESDEGIYNAMNKGIGMACGEYVEFLNSGDCLASPEVVGRVLTALEDNGFPSILYGNMLKHLPSGVIRRDRCFAGREITLSGMYRGCLNHSPTYIKKSLFTEKYGLYDETLKICSDWKWFMQAIVLGHEEPVYVDIDVTLFDMTGISETNKDLLEKERRSLLKEMIPSGILHDYDKWHDDVEIMARFEEHPAILSFVRFIERCLFQLDKIKAKEIVRK